MKGPAVPRDWLTQKISTKEVSLYAPEDFVEGGVWACAFPVQTHGRPTQAWASPLPISPTTEMTGPWHRLIFFLKKLLLVWVLCICVGAQRYIFTDTKCILEPKEIRRGHWIPQNWIYKWLWVRVWVLGHRPRSSEERYVSITKETSHQKLGEKKDS